MTEVTRETSASGSIMNTLPAPTHAHGFSKLWYNTNIPIPTDKAELELLYKYWNNRRNQMAYKAVRYYRGTPEFIHYRLIYSRCFELRKALDCYE